MSLLACTNGVLLTDTIGIDCSSDDKPHFKMKKLFLSSDNRFAIAATGDAIPSFYWPSVEKLLRRMLDVYYKDGGDGMELRASGKDVLEVKNLIKARQIVIVTSNAMFHQEDEGDDFSRFEHLISQGTYSNYFCITAEFKAMEKDCLLEHLSCQEIVDSAYEAVSYATRLIPKQLTNGTLPNTFEIDYVEQSRMVPYTQGWGE